MPDWQIDYREKCRCRNNFFWHSGIPAFTKDLSGLYSKLSSKGPTFQYTVYQLYELAGYLPPHRQFVYVQDVSFFTFLQFFMPERRTSGICFFRYRIEKKCQCWNAPDNGLRKPSPVTECSLTGLSCWMPEWRCRRHRPRYRCPAMVLYFLVERLVLYMFILTCYAVSKI